MRSAFIGFSPSPGLGPKRRHFAGSPLAAARDLSGFLLEIDEL